MIYKIEITDIAKKQIHNLKDKILKRDIGNKIKQLKYNPLKGKHLYNNLYELKAKNYRVYYLIYKGIISVENVEYDGTRYDGRVTIERVGDKNSQQRDIAAIKERM